MHEYSLAQTLVRQVVQLQERERASRVTSIHVSVGEFAGVDAELLRIAFQNVVSQTALARRSSWWKRWRCRLAANIAEPSFRSCDFALCARIVATKTLPWCEVRN